ncbi:MAG: hypothetical protein OXH86_02575 [Acidimicrobiaceae bacterium]|nr:hypothetical protein [Acidimicrobiaceae bacterium]MDE0319315.1 hypothetical protein [Acidimicrobiaceae bacterium]MDE0496215.1 hypothetical protein [Acidimicrobiaceae bacterium]
MSERIVGIRRGQILTEIDVASAVPGEGGQFTGLIDTGSQESGVSRRVIERLAATSPLIPESFKRVVPLGRAGVRTPAYRFWMGLRLEDDTGSEPTFGGTLGTFWQIPSQPDGFDVLVGMDLIERFAVKIDGGICTLRRRQPPSATAPAARR